MKFLNWILNLFNNKGSGKKTEPTQPKIEQLKTEPAKESEIKKIADLKNVLKNIIEMNK